MPDNTPAVIPNQPKKITVEDRLRLWQNLWRLRVAITSNGVILLQCLFWLKEKTNRSIRKSNNYLCKMSGLSLRTIKPLLKQMETLGLISRKTYPKKKKIKGLPLKEAIIKQRYLSVKPKAIWKTLRLIKEGKFVKVKDAPKPKKFSPEESARRKSILQSILRERRNEFNLRDSQIENPTSQLINMGLSDAQKKTIMEEFKARLESHKS